MMKKATIFIASIFLFYPLLSWAFTPYGMMLLPGESEPSVYEQYLYHKSINADTTSSGANICPSACTASGVPFSCCTGNGTGCDGTTIASSFPLLIKVYSGNFSSDELTHFFDASNSSGKRIRAYSSNKGSVLPYEVEYYTTNGSGYGCTASSTPWACCTGSGTGTCPEADIWVKVPTITSNAVNSNIVYLTYGNDPVGSNQDNPTAVWSNYVGVWHLGDNAWAASNPKALNSLGNNNGTDYSTTDTDGTVRRGRAFSGSSQYIDAGNISDFNMGTGNFTVSYWMNRTSNAATNLRIIAKGAGSDTEGGWAFWGSDTSVTFAVGNPTRVYSSGTIGTGNWYYVAGVRSGTAFHIVVNTTATADSATSGDITGNVTMDIGKNPSGSQYFIGSEDEIRIRKGTASAPEYLRLEYESMRVATSWNGDSFINWNAEE